MGEDDKDEMAFADGDMREPSGIAKDLAAYYGRQRNVVEPSEVISRQEGDHPGCCEDGDRVILWGRFFDHRGGGTPRCLGWHFEQALPAEFEGDFDMHAWRVLFCPFCGERLPK